MDWERVFEANLESGESEMKAEALCKILLILNPAVVMEDAEDLLKEPTPDLLHGPVLNHS